MAAIMFDADPNNTSKIYQTIAVTSGQKYSITFWQAATYQTGFVQNSQNWDFVLTLSHGTLNTTTGVRATVDATLTAPSPNPTGSPIPNTSVWQQVTLSFTAPVTTSNETLTIAAVAPVGGPPVLLIDGISMDAVPEPASWGLIVLGGLALAVRGRKTVSRTPRAN
jgi:PEP-CTERM motif